MNQDEMKRAVAKAALKYVQPDEIVGVGSGSTVNFFIEEVATMKADIEGAVASSEETARRLRAHHIPVYDLNAVSQIPVYIDGADEASKMLHLVKGGGGALMREKIIAAAAQKFICIIDETKLVGRLGNFPVAVEVIPMARSYVGRQIVKLGGDPVYREGFVTDNGNIILDIFNLTINEPVKLEQTINQIVGVVCCGIFGVQRADKLLIADANGIEEID